MPATMSVYGLYQYDNTLFDGMVLPPAINKPTLINYIIAECAELEISIPNPDTLKIMIESWSLSRLHSWTRLYESTVQDYNMIHNYDRYEDWTDTGNTNGTVNSGGSRDVTEKKAGYNGGGTVVAGETNESMTSNSGNFQYQSGEHKGHMYGNIGVTTAAQMIQGERDINAYDVYQAITDEFKRKFCVCVY